MKIMTQSLFALCAASALMPALAQVPAQNSRYPGYLIDQRDQIVMSGTGLCWRTSDWTPARAVAQCDPSFMPAATPAPQVAQAAPVPAPPSALTPLPARSRLERISFSADALFAFDKSVLKPEGKVMLNDLVRQLQGATEDGIVLTGHTDRFGTPRYNQSLSERRALAVKEYLVAKGIPASHIETAGKGEMAPETKPGDCKGARSAKVIACLQPDRRVDVEMKGTKPVVISR